MSELIAGHCFENMPGGEVCACGMMWIDIAPTRLSDVGKTGIAHAGVLNEFEYRQIEAKRERTWMAVRKVASP